MTSLQERLEVAPLQFSAGEPTEPQITDPVALLQYLERTRRFHRDSWFGRVFHPGRVALRENRPTDSLHIVVHDNHLMAHVDRVSPLGLVSDGPFLYSLRRAAAHNLVRMAQDLVRLLRGRQGDHRAALDCEWIMDSSQSALDDDDLLPYKSGWSVQLEARVAGKLDESRLGGALASVARRRRLSHDPLTVFQCADDEALGEARRALYGQRVALDDWPPLRAGLAHHPDGDVIMLNLNHAAGDGPAALRLMHLIAAAYAGAPVKPGQDPPDFLAACDLPVRPASAPVSKVGARYRAAVERIRDLLANPAHLAAKGGSGQPGYGYYLVDLPVTETRRIVDPARPEASRNALLAGLHLAIGEWNLEHGTPGHRVGVLIPVNLRPSRWLNDNLGNFSVMARVSTSRRHRRDGQSALRAIDAETARNRRGRTGIALIAALERSHLLPLWAKQSVVVLQPLTRNTGVDTAMFSDLGSEDEPPSFGADAGAVVDMWHSLPARAPETLCVGAITLEGHLHLTFRYPLRLFDGSAIRLFAACYLDQLAKLSATT